MKLLWTSTSPYARKAGIALDNAGVSCARGDVRTPEGARLHATCSPTGKIPVLLEDDGRSHADSNAIVAWLWRTRATELRARGLVLDPDDVDDRQLQVVVEAAMDAAINR